MFAEHWLRLRFALLYHLIVTSYARYFTYLWYVRKEEAHSYYDTNNTGGGVKFSSSQGVLTIPLVNRVLQEQDW